MSPPQPTPPRGARKDRPAPPSLPGSGSGWPRPIVWGLVTVAVLVVLLSPVLSSSSADELTYSEFRDKVAAGEVKKVEIANESSHIRGTFKKGNKEFTTTGPAEIPEADLALMREKGVDYDFNPPSSNLIGSILIWVLPVAIFVAFWWWMGRRAQGQMAGIMSIGRSKAKVYTTEKPKTTFADVAGYAGVKQEIREVVEFLKSPGK
jgi:cell division protease FtsH